MGWLVPTILGMGAISLLVTLGKFFNCRFARWTPRADAPTFPVVE